MTAATFSLFSFAGITATINFIDYDDCLGTVTASGFDAGGEYHFANVMGFDECFTSPAERDLAVAHAMNFVAAEMVKQATWQAA